MAFYEMAFTRIKHGAVCSPLNSLGHYILFLDSIPPAVLRRSHYLCFLFIFKLLATTSNF